MTFYSYSVVFANFSLVPIHTKKNNSNFLYSRNIPRLPAPVRQPDFQVWHRCGQSMRCQALHPLTVPCCMRSVSGLSPLSHYRLSLLHGRAVLLSGLPQVHHAAASVMQPAPYPLCRPALICKSNPYRSLVRHHPSAMRYDSLPHYYR